MTKKVVTITFEGIDGSGKETQSKKLFDYFNNQGLKSTLITFPDYSTKLGGFIKDSLQDKTFDKYALQMLFSADRIRQMPTILTNINDLDYAILDRYKWSGLVYGIARGLNESWVKNLEHILPDPDITFYVDIPVEVSLHRTKASDILESDKELLTKCRNKYLEMANSLNWQILNGTENIEIIHNKVIETINEFHRLPI